MSASSCCAGTDQQQQQWRQRFIACMHIRVASDIQVGIVTAVTAGLDCFHDQWLGFQCLQQCALHLQRLGVGGP